MVIYICIYVCVCIVLFDVIFAINIWYSDIILPQRTEYLEKQLKEHMKIKRHVIKRDMLLANKLRKRLLNLNWLLAYLHAFRNIEHQIHKDSEELQKLQHFNILLFKQLSEDYSKRSSESQAFFAYIVYSVIPNSNERSSYFKAMHSLAKKLALLIDSPSVYVRNNAFRAIVKTGSEPNIYYSLILMNEKTELRNSKFLSDYLGEFKGDVNKLNRILLGRFFEFSPPIQVMLVNYLRMLPKSVPQKKYYSILYSALCSERTDNEAIIAIIRYFGKHKYTVAYEKLIELLETASNKTKGYNYAAVAAGALRAYPYKRTIVALIRNLSNQDWFVRYNCAESLLYLNVDYEAIILNSKDQYAKDIMIHRSEVNNLRKGAEFS